jgi:hypothetical protein
MYSFFTVFVIRCIGLIETCIGMAAQRQQQWLAMACACGPAQKDAAVA